MALIGGGGGGDEAERSTDEAQVNGIDRTNHHNDRQPQSTKPSRGQVRVRRWWPTELDDL